MPSFRLPFSPVSIAAGTVGVLIVVYLTLIATVMGYAALTIEFTQSVRNNAALIAELESQYLAAVSQITTIDYASAGYAKPVAEAFVPVRPTTALR